MRITLSKSFDAVGEQKVWSQKRIHSLNFPCVVSMMAVPGVSVRASTRLLMSRALSCLMVWAATKSERSWPERGRIGVLVGVVADSMEAAIVKIRLL